MAAVVICECCGKVRPIKSMVHVRVHKITSPEHYSTRTEDYFDMCMDCYKNVEALLKHKETDR